jgi:glutamine synthetase
LTAFDSTPRRSTASIIDSDEGRWNTGRANEGDYKNLGYRTRYKEGYFPVPPADHYQDLRSEMVLKMMAIGMDVECQHHEVATAARPKSTCASTRC